jgi:hypothetical protein
MFFDVYILELLRFETIMFSDAALSDINVELCYVLSQYHIDSKEFVCFTLRLTNQWWYRVCEKTCSKIQCRNIVLTTDFIGNVF